MQWNKISSIYGNVVIEQRHWPLLFPSIFLFSFSLDRFIAAIVLCLMCVEWITFNMRCNFPQPKRLSFIPMSSLPDVSYIFDCLRWMSTLRTVSLFIRSHSSSLSLARRSSQFWIQCRCTYIYCVIVQLATWSVVFDFYEPNLTQCQIVGSVYLSIETP